MIDGLLLLYMPMIIGAALFLLCWAVADLLASLVEMFIP